MLEMSIIVLTFQKCQLLALERQWRTTACSKVIVQKVIIYKDIKMSLLMVSIIFSVLCCVTFEYVCLNLNKNDKFVLFCILGKIIAILTFWWFAIFWDHSLIAFQLNKFHILKIYTYFGSLQLKNINIRSHTVTSL